MICFALAMIRSVLNGVFTRARLGGSICNPCVGAGQESQNWKNGELKGGSPATGGDVRNPINDAYVSEVNARCQAPPATDAREITRRG